MASVLAISQADFALRLLNELDKDASGIMSPLSIFYTMAICAEGAAGSTRDEILYALTRGKTLAETRQQFTESLRRHARGSMSTEYTLDLVNMMYAKGSTRILPEFIRIVKEEYCAHASTVADATTASQKINDLVSAITRGRIPALMEPHNLEDAPLVFINSVYLDLKWQEIFLPGKTRPETFYRDHFPPFVQCDMMRQTGTFKYFCDNAFEVVLLPYYGCDINFAVFLPRRKCGLTEALRKLDGENLLGAIRQCSPKHQWVLLPKFRLHADMTELKPVLEKVGIRNAFDPLRADFSHMASPKERLYVSKLVHKATIEVTEEGTVAAAGTFDPLGPLGHGLQVIPQFRADHPFLYAIVDSHDTILFSGVYRG